MAPFVRIRTVLAATLLSVAVARSLWFAFTAYAIADHAASAKTVLTADLTRRYDRLDEALSGLRQASYREPSGNPWGTVRYLLARMEALPTVLLPSPGTHRVAVFDADSEEELDAWIRAEGATPRVRLGNGLAVVEVAP